MKTINAMWIWEAMILALLACSTALLGNHHVSSSMQTAQTIKEAKYFGISYGFLVSNFCGGRTISESCKQLRLNT